MPESREIFSELEVADIVKRAVELQESNRAADYVPGVTRDELSRIAGEMGVDVSYLDQAIRERFNPEPPRRGLRGLMPQPVERVVEGELSPEDYDLLAEELPTRASNAPPSQVGRTMTAKVMTGLTMADVAVTARRGRTRIKVSPLPLLPILFSIQLALIGAGIGGSIIEKGPVMAGIGVIAAGLLAGAALLVGGLRHAKKVSVEIAERLVRRFHEEHRHESGAPPS